jgi:hypothetical protein
VPLGVTGNTSDSGSEESWFEPRRGNCKAGQRLPRVRPLSLLGWWVSFGVSISRGYRCYSLTGASRRFRGSFLSRPTRRREWTDRSDGPLSQCRPTPPATATALDGWCERSERHFLRYGWHSPPASLLSPAFSSAFAIHCESRSADTCEHFCDQHRASHCSRGDHGPGARRQGDGDALDDVRAGVAEAVKNSSVGDCMRGPTGDLPGPTVPPSAPRHRFASGVSVHTGHARGEHPLLATPSI